MKKSILAFLILSTPLFVLADEIACYDASSSKPALTFTRQGSIPNDNFEKFPTQSLYGSVTINEKDLGQQALSIRSSGPYLNYEIKIQNASRRPLAYVHLSLDKSGIFNGYQQYDDSVSGRQVIQMLTCDLTSTSHNKRLLFGGVCCSRLPSNATGCDPGC